MTRLLAACLLALLVACSGDSTGPNEVTGSWRLKSVNGAGLPQPVAFSGGVGTVTSGALTFAASGAYTLSLTVTTTDGTSTATTVLSHVGTWTLSANKVTFNDATDGAVYPGFVNGNTLTVASGGGEVDVYSR